ncbi:FecR family protein [Sunxiuqinia sp. A32]|uniref:FecR family protein n=1 Tax=Sunxiuqinia sp. A32 TaxID=3461496 RepID=UPI0040458BAD
MQTVVQKREEKINHFISHYHVPAGLDKKVVLEKILRKIEEGKYKDQGDGKIFFLSPVYRIAISTAAFLLVFFLLQFFLSTIVINSDDLISNSYLLPDDSRVMMDVNSEISFPKHWWKREVKLKGTAYFDVTKGRKFKVKTKYGDIQVLGTRFQIKIINDGLVVNCYSGTVKLSSSKFEQLIHEGNSVTLKNNQIDQITPITEEYPEIARFYQHFSQVNIKIVAEEIEYFFNVDIEIKDTTLLKHFSGSIHATDCESALKMLCEPLDLTYTFNSSQKKYIIVENN